MENHSISAARPAPFHPQYEGHYNAVIQDADSLVVHVNDLWMHTIFSTGPMAAKPPWITLYYYAGYAARGISDIMPTPGLCRVSISSV